MRPATREGGFASMHKSEGKPNWLQLAGNAARRNYIIG